MVDNASADANTRGVLDILEPIDEPGPRQGLGGWGLPSSNPAIGPEHLSLVMGYCLEKITNQFAFLRSLTLKGAELQKSLQQVSVARPGAKVNLNESPHRKKAVAALDEARTQFAEGQFEALEALALNEDYLNALNASEKKGLLRDLLQHDTSHQPAYQQAALFLLRNAGDRRSFQKLLDAAGGKDVLLERLKGLHKGAFSCLLEHYEVDDWQPPFHHGIFSGEVEGDTAGDDPLGVLKEQMVSEMPPIIKDDYMDRFLQGDIMASDMMGLSREELYMIAQRGYELIQEGKLIQAREVFDGLVYLDPYDPYFYTVLGSVCQKQNDLDDAVYCYNIAIRLQAWNVNALANRGEILLNQGKLTEALQDLQAVITYEPDPENTNPSVVRTKALLFTIKEIVDQKAQESSSN